MSRSARCSSTLLVTGLVLASPWAAVAAFAAPADAPVNSATPPSASKPGKGDPLGDKSEDKKPDKKKPDGDAKDKDAKDKDANCPDKEHSEWGDRTLKGHTFPTPVLNNATSAFVTTHFGVRQGASVTLVPGFPDANAGKFNLTATGLVQNFDLGIKIVDWIGVFALGAGTVNTGANVPTLLSQDNSFNVSGEVGAIVRIARIESSGTQIALRASVGGGTGRVLNILGLLNKVTSGGASIDTILGGNIGQLLLVPQSNVTFQGSLHAAQAITKNFGLQASVELRQTNTTVSPYDPTTQATVSQTLGSTSLANTLAFSVDGAPIGIPVAVVPEYQLLADLSGGTGVSHALGLGIYYSGRRDLQVGVAGVTQVALQPLQGVDASGNPAQSGTPSVFFG
jgi:hypothetical protein